MFLLELLWSIRYRTSILASLTNCQIRLFSSLFALLGAPLQLIVAIRIVKFSRLIILWDILREWCVCCGAREVESCVASVEGGAWVFCLGGLRRELALMLVLLAGFMPPRIGSIMLNTGNVYWLYWLRGVSRHTVLLAKHTLHESGNWWWVCTNISNKVRTVCLLLLRF